MNKSKLFGIIVAYLKEMIKEKEECFISSEDKKILIKWGIKHSKLKPKEVRPSGWSMPMHNQVKINFDGALKGNPREVGGGGVYRDGYGKVIWAFTEYYGNQTNDEAKL